MSRKKWRVNHNRVWHPGKYANKRRVCRWISKRESIRNYEIDWLKLTCATVAPCGESERNFVTWIRRSLDVTAAPWNPRPCRHAPQLRRRCRRRLPVAIPASLARACRRRAAPGKPASWNRWIAASEFPPLEQANKPNIKTCTRVRGDTENGER